MIQRLIILLENCHAFSLSSFCFLPAHITAAHKLLFREIKNEIKFNSDHTATKVDWHWSQTGLNLSTGWLLTGYITSLNLRFFIPKMEAIF